jgi:UDP-N-acetylmuramyl tripeptide synthase
MLSHLLALIVGKLIGFLTQTLKLGGGSAAPGLYALKSDPMLIQRLAKQIPTNIIITGTNGKTTTARLLNQLLTKQGLKVVRNSTGSNLERGIASALLTKASFWGEIKQVDIGLWEVDEAAFNTLLPKLKPTVVVFLNAFRDQLDRYGEVDTVIKKWQSSLDKHENPCIVILNGDDNNVSRIVAPKTCNVEYFGLNDAKIEGEKGIKHISHDLTVEAKNIKLAGFSGTTFDLVYPEGKISLHLPLPGTYQIYNLLAAFSAYRSLNLPLEKSAFDLKDFTSAFGRVEQIEYRGKKGVIMLIKNPVGATQVFETIREELTAKDVLVAALNDNFADGKDVSWIWDAEFEKFKIQNSKFKIICGGTRAYDMAIRFKYAGVPESRLTVISSLTEAFDMAFKTEGKVVILPTYTALLELQKILANKGIKKHYWQES